MQYSKVSLTMAAIGTKNENTYYDAFRESIHRDLSYCGLSCRNRNPRGIKTRFILE